MAVALPYAYSMLCIFPEKEVNKMLLLVENIGHDGVKNIKGCVSILKCIIISLVFVDLVFFT